MSREGAGNGALAQAHDGTAASVTRALYERYATRVLRICVERLGDRDEAADAVQDTFLKAWLALRDGVEVRHPLPWLLTIADNVCVSRLRARGARVTTTTLVDDTSVELSDAVGDVAGLTAALRTLPARQRQALLRRELQGYSYDEIGAELGVSRASVAALLHRARLAVADTLREARRGIAAIAPVPAALRTPFEHGIASTAAVASTAVISVTQLAGAGSAPSPPVQPRPAEAIAAVVLPSGDAAVTQLDPRTPKSMSRRSSSTERARAGDTDRSAHPRDAVSVLVAAAVAPDESSAAHVPPTLAHESTADAAPQVPVPETPPTVAGPETSAPPKPKAGDEPSAPPTAGDEPSAAPETPQKPRAYEASGVPGKQPRGERGRSQHTPGHVRKSEAAPQEIASVDAPAAPDPAAAEPVPTDADTAPGPSDGAREANGGAPQAVAEKEKANGTRGGPPSVRAPSESLSG